MRVLLIGEPQGLAQSLKDDFVSKGLDIVFVSNQNEAETFLSVGDIALVVGDFTNDAISLLQWARKHPAKPVREVRYFFVVNATKPAMEEIQERHGAAFFTLGQWYARGMANFGNLEQPAA